MKKIGKIILTTVPIVGTLGGVGAYIAVHMNKGQPETTVTSNNKYLPPDEVTESDGSKSSQLVDKFQVFPQLRQEQFYKYIRIESGRAVMNKDFIANVVNYVIKNMQISDGSIEWGYQVNGYRTWLKLTFKWITGLQGRTFTKTYSFDLSKDV